MTSHMDYTDDLDMSVEAMHSVQVRRPGKIRRAGEKRYSVKRVTSHGVVTVRRGLTFDLGMYLAKKEGGYLEMEE